MTIDFTCLAILGGSIAVGLSALAGLLCVLGGMGNIGRAIIERCIRAPGLDLIVSLFTWMPWVIGASLAGWRGLLAALIGQIVALMVWVCGHELAFRRYMRGPRIVKFLNRTVGRWQNHLALWVTLVALPGFLFIRGIEWFCWPMLVWLLDFPRYRQSEWVNVSRHKFEGLIGHDLIWCLYCDWMTGVYSLGAEMLRNVESFWCPIRFYDGKKCDNCKLDFPDIAGGWVSPEGSMADVEQTMEKMYANGRREWFGHPARLTVRGKEISGGEDAKTPPVP